MPYKNIASLTESAPYGAEIYSAKTSNMGSAPPPGVDALVTDDGISEIVTDDGLTFIEVV